MSDSSDRSPHAASGLGPRQAEGPVDAPGARRRRRGWAIAAVVLLAVAVTALVVGLLDRKEGRDARDAAALRTRIAAEERRLARTQAPHRAAARDLAPAREANAAQRLAARTALYDAARRSILLDARARTRTGELTGPYSNVTCTPYERDPNARPDHLVLGHVVGRYDCLAVQREEIKGIQLGQPFVAALDFERFTYVWCRNTPPPSERGKSLVFVRLDRTCLAATGKPLGTGYALTPSEEAGGR